MQVYDGGLGATPLTLSWTNLAAQNAAGSNAGARAASGFVDVDVWIRVALSLRTLRGLTLLHARPALDSAIKKCFGLRPSHQYDLKLVAVLAFIFLVVYLSWVLGCLWHIVHNSSPFVCAEELTAIGDTCLMIGECPAQRRRYRILALPICHDALRQLPLAFLHKPAICYV
jgi:hypothetical protein